VLELTLNRADQNAEHNNDQALEGASDPDLQQLPKTTFDRNELDVSHPDLFAQAFAVLQGVSDAMDLHTRGLADKTQDIVAMAHARLEEDADVVVEDVSRESLPTKSKRTTIPETDKPNQCIKTTTLEFIPSANAWKVSDEESEHMSPVRGHSLTVNTTPPRTRRALVRKALKKNAWKKAILEFRATHGTSDASSGSPSPSPPSAGD
jgi:hypothetical protein